LQAPELNSLIFTLKFQTLKYVFRIKKIEISSLVLASQIKKLVNVINFFKNGLKQNEKRDFCFPFLEVKSSILTELFLLHFAPTVRY
jgi:hypothetical protein